jgi:hypothetical protein
MKSVICFLCIILLSGCAGSAPYALYQSPDAAILTSRSDSAVKGLIGDKLDIKFSFGGISLSYALMTQVDGEAGKSVMPYMGRTFNSSVSGQFAVNVSPGKHHLVLLPNYHLANPNDTVDVEIETKAGHEYFIGCVLDVSKQPVSVAGFYVTRGQYRWVPVVVDKTEMKLIHPVI